jgi:hypothetical protein
MIVYVCLWATLVPAKKVHHVGIFYARESVGCEVTSRGTTFVLLYGGIMWHIESKVLCPIGHKSSSKNLNVMYVLGSNMAHFCEVTYTSTLDHIWAVQFPLMWSTC